MTAVDDDRLMPVPMLIGRVAQATPTAPAVLDATGELDFSTLLRCADQLAGRLVEAGVGIQQRVGVMVGHSRQLVVSVLGVLRAGAVYVPIDPGHPVARRRQVAAASGLVALITDEDPVRAGAELSVPALRPEGGGSGRLAHDRRVDPDDLACLIHTSGSTGEPKGVMITHRGLSTLVAAAIAEFELRPDDRFLASAALTFSASLEEVFPPLARGAALVFPPDRSYISTSHGLLRFVEDRAVTVLEMQTAQWHLLVRYLLDTGERLPRSLRLMVMGGDRAAPELVRAWDRTAIPLVHVYGPTETTATASYWAVPAGGAPADGLLSIGTPIPHTHVVVVDRDLRPAAPGEPGELLVGGDTLARGYHGRPAATAEKFVPDPFSGRPGALLYRTGDLVRELPDGRVLFLDRIDQQVKVRGHRVEPAEVEAALRAHPEVREAVVVPRTGHGGHRHLVGYVTAAPGTVSGGELRRFLADRVPDHLVPAAVAVLAEFPLTPHRKVDRAVLPDPAPGRPELRTEYVPPRDGVEKRLSVMAAELLRVDEIGVLDHFFDLGGDSLFLLKLINRVAAEMDVRLGLPEAAADGTVRGLADRLRERRAA